MTKPSGPEQFLRRFESQIPGFIDLPAAGERWSARSRRHGGEVVQILRVTGPTVKFEVIRGASNHRKQVYALRLEHFLRAFTKGAV